MEYAAMLVIAAISWAVGVRMGAAYAAKRIAQEFELG